MDVNTKRLFMELGIISKTYDVELVNDNIKHWQIAVHGPDSTPYFGCKFLVEIIFPSTYPFEKPVVSFKTIIYHPNISKKGEMCMGSLADWKPKNTVGDIMTFIYNLLSEPDPHNPLEPQIAVQYLSNRQEYENKAREIAHKYAM
jgi:ubiquitin-conjugating enzyme E2 D/E